MTNMSVNNVSAANLGEKSQIVSGNHLLESNQLNDVSLKNLQKSKNKLRKELMQIRKLIQKGKYEEAKKLWMKYYDNVSQNVSKLKNFIDQEHPNNEKVLNKDLNKLKQELLNAKNQVKNFRITKSTEVNCIIVLEECLEKSSEGNNANLKQFLDRSNYVLNQRFKDQMTAYNAETAKISAQVDKMKDDLNKSGGLSWSMIGIMVGCMVAGALLAALGGAVVSVFAEMSEAMESATIADVTSSSVSTFDTGAFDGCSSIGSDTETIAPVEEEMTNVSDWNGTGDTQASSSSEVTGENTENPEGTESKAKAKAGRSATKSGEKVTEQEAKNARSWGAKKWAYIKENFPSLMKKLWYLGCIGGGGIVGFNIYEKDVAPKDMSAVDQGNLTVLNVQSQAIYSAIENTMNDKRQNFTQEQNVTSQTEATTNQITNCQQTFVGIARSAFGRG